MFLYKMQKISKIPAATTSDRCVGWQMEEKRCVYELEDGMVNCYLRAVHDLTLTRQRSHCTMFLRAKKRVWRKNVLAYASKATMSAATLCLSSDTLIPNNNGSICTLYQGRAWRCRISVSSQEHKPVFLRAQSAEVSLCFSVCSVCFEQNNSQFI